MKKIDAFDSHRNSDLSLQVNSKRTKAPSHGENYVLLLLMLVFWPIKLPLCFQIIFFLIAVFGSSNKVDCRKHQVWLKCIYKIFTKLSIYYLPGPSVINSCFCCEWIQQINSIATSPSYYCVTQNIILKKDLTKEKKSCPVCFHTACLIFRDLIFFFL